MKKVKLLSSLVCVLVAFNSMMAQQLDVFINDDTQPTNYRNAPNGKIVGQLKNGEAIVVQCKFRGIGIYFSKPM